MKVWWETVLHRRNKVQRFCMFEGHEEDRSLEHNKWFYSRGGAYHGSYSHGNGFGFLLKVKRSCWRVLSEKWCVLIYSLVIPILFVCRR